jgi:hypothetical protein
MFYSKVYVPDPARRLIEIVCIRLLVLNPFEMRHPDLGYPWKFIAFEN